MKSVSSFSIIDMTLKFLLILRKSSYESRSIYQPIEMQHFKNLHLFHFIAYAVLLNFAPGAFMFLKHFWFPLDLQWWCVESLHWTSICTNYRILIRHFFSLKFWSSRYFTICIYLQKKTFKSYILHP